MENSSEMVVTGCGIDSYISSFSSINCQLSIYLHFCMYVFAEVYCLLARVKLTRPMRKVCLKYWDGSCLVRFRQNWLHKKTRPACH